MRPRDKGRNAAQFQTMEHTRTAPSSVRVDIIFNLLKILFQLSTSRIRVVALQLICSAPLQSRKEPQMTERLRVEQTKWKTKWTLLPW